MKIWPISTRVNKPAMIRGYWSFDVEDGPSLLQVARPTSRQLSQQMCRQKLRRTVLVNTGSVQVRTFALVALNRRPDGAFSVHLASRRRIAF